MCFDISLVDDQNGIYMPFAKGQSTSSSVVKLPAVLMKVDKQGNYFVEQVFDVSNSGDSVPLSDARWEDLEFPVVCPYCAEKTQFVLGACLVFDEQGGVLMQREVSQDVYGPPIGLLRVEEKGNCTVVAFLNPVSGSSRTTDMSRAESSEVEHRVADEDPEARESAAETIARCSAAIQEDPSNVDAYYTRALAYSLQGDHTSASDDLGRVLQLDPQNIPAIVARGVLHGIQGEHDLAMKDLDMAIELDSEYLPAYLNRGICHYEMDDHDLALKDLEKVLENSTQPVLVEQAKQYSVMCRRQNGLRRCEKVMAYFYNGRHDQAVGRLKKIVKSDPDNAAAHFYLGMIYDSNEDYESAVSVLDRAIELDAQFPYAHNLRGWIHLKTRHYTRAIADFTEEIEYNPDCVLAYLNRAHAYHDILEHGTEIADLKRALELSDDPQQRAKIQRQIRAISKY
ncbi:MAG: tetratricopeptide repeat protein [Dehalococcoidia bacterium]